MASSAIQLGYVIVYVEDVEKTLAFYQQAFGFDIRMKYEEEGSVSYGELETGAAVLGFASHAMSGGNFRGDYIKPSAEGDPYGQEIAFVTEDVVAVFERAMAAGAIALAEPTQKPWGQTVAYLRAQEGTLIEVCSPISA